MTASDYIELIILSRDSAGSLAMNFIGVLFAYVVANYVVAGKLTLFQFWSLTVVYTLFSLSAVLGVYNTIELGVSISEAFHEELPAQAAQYRSIDPAIGGGQQLVVPSVLLFAWLLSVVNSLLLVRKSQPRPDLD